MLWTAPERPFDADLARKLGEVRDRLALAAAAGRVVLATSLQAEDQILTHLIALDRLPIAFAALDTGMLPQETLATLAATEARYGVSIERFGPDPAHVAAYRAKNGEHGFYESVAARRACCAIRKVEPLRRALAGRDAWITGQRREQDQGRAGLEFVKRDDAHGLLKFNPLADWTLDDVWGAARHLDPPLNPLHGRGYASIGCEPCTRAIRAGEEIRAGRWWWESGASKECGLHVAATGAAA